MGSAAILDMDAQNRPPEAYCVRCQGELWGPEADGDEWVLCPTCKKELSWS